VSVFFFLMDIPKKCSHRRGILSILKLSDDPPPTRKEVALALSRWNAVDFETEAASRGMCASALRSFAQWDRHLQAKALAGTPPVSLTKIGDGPKQDVTENPSRPLDGIRVLDLSRVLAGPIAGRTLAGNESFYAPFILLSPLVM
jgi:hypothetical protein